MEVAEGRKAVAGGGGGKPNGGLPCPRCLSTNTKFSYYNNYSLAQPRHFCKACRRYWTLGGALRDVPVGGGTRKKHAAAARSRPAPGPSTAQTPTVAFAPPYALAYASVLSAPAEWDTDRRLLDPGGSFSSLLAPAFNGLYAGFMGASASEPGAEVAASVTQPPVAEALPVGYWGLGCPDLSM